MKTACCVTIALAAILASCGPPGMLLDRNLTEIQLKSTRLTPDSHLRVLHGDAVRRIPLKAVSQLEIFTEDYTNREGEVFYACRLVLKSGEEIIPRAEKNQLSKTYVCVSGFVTARGREGTVRISLDNVAKLVVR